MSDPCVVAVVVGSLRRQSLNRKTADVLVAMAPAHLKFAFAGFDDLPLYNEELEGPAAPQAWTRFRREIGAADALLFVTPEYNRSVPGGLKNAIDAGSRPMGESVWAGKPAAVVSVSPGAIGGFGANHHLRQMAAHLDMPMLQQPEMYLGRAGDLFDGDGALKDESGKKLFARFIAAYADWIGRVRKG